VRYTALLDANVLVPYTLTDVLLRLAEAGFYRPLWSVEVLGETERTLAHMDPGLESAKFRDRLAAMDRSFTDASVTGWESLVESFDLPDPGDRHVVAAAVVGGADAIVTANLNDFPDHALGAFDLVAIHPDDFLLDQWDLNPDLAAQVLREQLRPANDLRSPCPTSLASSHVRAHHNSPPAPRPCVTRAPELTKVSEPRPASCPGQRGSDPAASGISSPFQTEHHHIVLVQQHTVGVHRRNSSGACGVLGELVDELLQLSEPRVIGAENARYPLGRLGGIASTAAEQAFDVGPILAPIGQHLEHHQVGRGKRLDLGSKKDGGLGALDDKVMKRRVLGQEQVDRGS